MRSIAAFIAVNLLFIGAALVAAGTILALGKMANSSDEPMIWFLICLVGVASGIGFLWAATRFIGRAGR